MFRLANAASVAVVSYVRICDTGTGTLLSLVALSCMMAVLSRAAESIFLVVELQIEAVAFVMLPG